MQYYSLGCPRQKRTVCDVHRPNAFMHSAPPLVEYAGFQRFDGWFIIGGHDLPEQVWECGPSTCRRRMGVQIAPKDGHGSSYNRHQRVISLVLDKKPSYTALAFGPEQSVVAPVQSQSCGLQQQKFEPYLPMLNVVGRRISRCFTEAFDISICLRR